MTVLCRVLTQRRQHDTVLQSQPAELQRLEQFGDWLAIVNEGSSRNGVLEWCEV